MPSELSYNSQWWKEAKAASLARKSAVSLGTLAKPGDSFLIVTEGQVTEPVYFETIRQKLKLGAMHIKVIPSTRPDALNVIRKAVEEQKAHTLKIRRGELPIKMPAKFDHVWAVIDTDVLTDPQKWAEVVKSANDKKVKLAYSTPCFEFWLLLHLEYTTRSDLIDCNAAKAAVKACLHPTPYSTVRKEASHAIGSLVPKYKDAIKHAQRVREHHKQIQTPEPANPSTAVDTLLSAILEAAPAYLRTEN